VKDRLAQLVAEAPPAVDPRNLTREYLQARILLTLQRAGALRALAFHGGTALRFLYGIARYSEDLDFALERPAAGYDLRALLRGIEVAFGSEGYDVRVKFSDKAVVHKAFVGFPGLLHYVGASPHRDEVIAVKLEVDTRPPAGAGLQVSVVRRLETLRLQHHDLPSLYAGKLAAVLCRSYTKGRDLYDLLWYLGEHPGLQPNLTMLGNAIVQTGREASLVQPDWRGAVARRLEEIDWEAAKRDVSRFLEDARDVDLIDPETITGLLDAAR
jgi:hypothetical protein